MSEDSYLFDIINESATTIREDLFVNRYLKLLFHYDPAAFNISWLNEVAKSPHARVYVTDKTGKIIYSIPPLRAGSFLTSASEELIRALNNIQLESNMHASRGAMLLEANLPNLIKLDIDASTYLSEWKAILDRYNLSDKYVNDNSDQSENNQIIFNDDEW